MSEELISSFIDLPAVKSEKDEFLSMIKQVSDAFDKIKDVKVSLNGASSYKEIADGAKQLKTAQDDLAKQQEKLNQLNTEQARKLAEIKVLQQEQVKANKDTAKETLGMVSAYDQLNKQYKDAAQLAKSLAATYGVNSDAAKQAAAQANELNNKLKAIDASVGEHKRKIGDYVGAVSLLEKSLQDVGQKLNQMASAGQNNTQEFQKLREEYSLLQTLTSQQAKGFSSVTMEIRNNERALQSLNAAGLKDTELFQQLQESVANAKRELHDLNVANKILASDVPAVTALTTAAKGLAGAYAVGAGAAALFADGDEKVQKEIAKLVAVMTILQGLQEAHELLQQRGAIAMALQTTATKVATFFQKIYAATTLESAAATTALRISIGLLTGGLLLLLPLAAFAFEKLAEAQKESNRESELNDELQKKTVENYDTEIAKTRVLISELENENTSKKRKHEIVGQLQDQYPNYFKNIDAEKTSVGELEKAYSRLTQALILQAKIKAAQDLIAEKQKKIFELETSGVNDEVNNWDALLAGIRNFGNTASTSLDLVATANKRAAEDTKGLQKDIDSLIKKAVQSSQELDKIGGDPHAKGGGNKLVEKIKAAKDETEKLIDIFRKLKAQADVIFSTGSIDALFQSEQEKKFKEEADAIQRNFLKRKNYLQEANDIELTALTERKNKGEISEQEYQSNRLRITKDSNGFILRAELEAADQTLALYKSVGIDVTEQEAKIAAIRLKIAENTSDAVKKSTLKSQDEINKELSQKYKELGDEVGDLFKTLVDAGYEKQKNAIQDQIDLLNQKKEKDTEVANATITNEQQKAAAIATINARAANQAEALQRKQRQLDEQKAKFDKAFNVAKIVEETSIAVVRALGDDTLPGPARIGLATLIGAIGAIQIAKVIATPIPKYKDGTENHPGGLAIVGDGGRSERITLPDGRSFDTPNRSTLMDLPAGAKVFPDAMVFKRLGELPVQSQYGEILQLKKELKDIKTAIINKPVSRIQNTYAGVQQSFHSAHRDWKYIQDNTNY